ncbi:Sec-independent protein translocase subunit TatA/TatB [Pontibacter virosus]|uniref:Sec-independent protein translocase protein TatA n=1 Tax=Pontibacter virosus TaxID=1765052 RepID=A0A2U1B0L5_9BACT|nr:twin-arginine translocase TatA/TatE family subunit [Pontibacter virosus]PVY42226.1 sec-independent protein translocase protein TatA [Pontibacter virosus]
MNSIGIFAFIGSLGGAEVTIIIFAILLLFGAKRIPELARGLGRGIREFKDATNEIKDELDKSVNGKQGPTKNSSSN